jgi:hypothetical protein
VPGVRNRAGALLAFLIVAVVTTVRADAQEASILHEFIPPDPGEDVSFAATTLDGDLPAAIQTPSGVATAPDPRRPPDSEHVYGGATTDDSPDSTYEPDRDTRRPNVENYDDPFSPATAPFKRLRAYDAVDADYTLRVRDRTLARFQPAGLVGSGDEPFYGDLSVDLAADQPVRIPTVGPGARVIKMHVNPPTDVELLRDQADNWFVRGKTRVRARLVVELAIARDTFGSAFADPDWPELEARVGPQPAAHKAAYQEVARAIGISRAMRPREVMTKMVEYFRGFAPSEEPPRERGDIYLDLALSKKGVCRHRAFAFLVTGLNAGIPTRMVVNEAHAWVEVHDGALWHRVDLGGAAANLDQEIEPGRPPYVPPPDPFAWPSSRDSGDDLAARSRDQQASQDPNAGPSPNGSGSVTVTSPTASGSAPPSDPNRPGTDVVVSGIDKDIRRGLPVHLKGDISSSGGPCAHVRVDVVLIGPELPHGAVVGSLSTDEAGRYDGAVVIPRDFSVGEYELIVTTPGDARCAPSQSK